MEIRDRPCLVKTRDRPLSRRGEKHWVNLREKGGLQVQWRLCCAAAASVMVGVVIYVTGYRQTDYKCRFFFPTQAEKRTYTVGSVPQGTESTHLGYIFVTYQGGLIDI